MIQRVSQEAWTTHSHCWVLNGNLTEVTKKSWLCKAFFLVISTFSTSSSAFLDICIKRMRNTTDSFKAVSTPFAFITLMHYFAVGKTIIYITAYWQLIFEISLQQSCYSCWWNYITEEGEKFPVCINPCTNKG